MQGESCDPAWRKPARWKEWKLQVPEENILATAPSDVYYVPGSRGCGGRSPLHMTKLKLASQGEQRGQAQFSQ